MSQWFVCNMVNVFIRRLCIVNKTKIINRLVLIWGCFTETGYKTDNCVKRGSASGF